MIIVNLDEYKVLKKYDSKEISREFTDTANIFSVFKKFFPVIWEEKEKIINTPNMYYTHLPFAFISMAYIGGDSIPLGALLSLWQLGLFTRPCPGPDKQQECEGQILVTKAGGSPLSGTCRSYGFCPVCGTESRLENSNMRKYRIESKKVNLRSSNYYRRKKTIKGYKFSWKGLTPGLKNIVEVKQHVKPLSFKQVLKNII
ncbi:MAG TPA: hypothetical protein VKS21_03250 [Spirochaetota bacterium]|nr:hypothetical protein [Spirochaetota bacterium]